MENHRDWEIVKGEWERIENSLFSLSKSVDGTSAREEKSRLRSRVFIFPHHSSSTTSNPRRYNHCQYMTTVRTFKFTLLYFPSLLVDLREVFQNFLSNTCASNLFSSRFSSEDSTLNRYLSNESTKVYQTPSQYIVAQPLNFTPPPLPVTYAPLQITPPYYSVGAVHISNNNSPVPLDSRTSSDSSSGQTTPESYRDFTSHPPPGLEKSPNAFQPPPVYSYSPYQPPW